MSQECTVLQRKGIAMTHEELVEKLQAAVEYAKRGDTFPGFHPSEGGDKGRGLFWTIVTVTFAKRDSAPRVSLDELQNRLGEFAVSGSLQLSKDAPENKTTIDGRASGRAFHLHLLGVIAWQVGDEAMLDPVDEHFQRPSDDPSDPILVPIADLPPPIKVRIINLRPNDKADVEIIEEKATGARGTVDVDNLHPV